MLLLAQISCSSFSSSSRTSARVRSKGRSGGAWLAFIRHELCWKHDLWNFVGTLNYRQYAIFATHFYFSAFSLSLIIMSVWFTQEVYSSLLHFNKDTGMLAILTIIIKVWWYCIMNFTQFNWKIRKKHSWWPNWRYLFVCYVVVSIQWCQKNPSQLTLNTGASGVFYHKC